MTTFGGRLFDLLPDYLREADDGTLAGYMTVLGAGGEVVNTFVNGADPDTSTSGTCEPVNPATTPAGWLPWLGWLGGVPYQGLSVSDARWYLSRSGAQAHGAAAGIQASVQATLTGTRFCQVDTAVGGDPWVIEVYVVAGEVVDASVTLAAAMREKPAGADLTLWPTDAVTWDELDTAYGTWADMTATGKTWRELRFG